MQKKIINNFKDLKYLSQRYKNKKIVLCHGVFDLLHIGHINHFKEAKNLGDILVVSITGDNYVRKGPNRPAFNFKQRMEAIASLEIVDFVYLNNNPTSVEVIKYLKPKIYCKGPDYKKNEDDITGNINKESQELKKNKGKIVYTRSETYSSSKLINDYSLIYNDSQKKFLKKVSSNFNFEKLKSLINEFSNLNISVFGELIIDRYVFSSVLGKSGKEPHLVAKRLHDENYIGGSGAIANHLSTFCKKIDLITMLGEKKEHLNFIKKNLSKNIFLNFIKKKESPTIVKTRFVDYISYSKIIGVYDLNDSLLSKKQELEISNLYKKQKKKSDILIIVDYGHGFISKKNVILASKKTKFVCVNSQINSSNAGYHDLKKYEKIDLLVINEKELRYEFRDAKSEIIFLMKKLSKLQNIKKIIVTQGRNGATLYDKKLNEIVKCPAFTDRIVDKVGAGDAMLAIVSMCLKKKISNEVSLLLGSLAAAFITENLGNKFHVNKVEILKALKHLGV